MAGYLAPPGPSVLSSIRRKSARPSFLDGAGLESGLAFLDVHAEFDAPHPVALDDGVAVFRQRALELVEREPIQRFSAALFRRGEFVVDAPPLGALWIAAGLRGRARRRRRGAGRLSREPARRFRGLLRKSRLCGGTSR